MLVLKKPWQHPNLYERWIGQIQTWNFCLKTFTCLMCYVHLHLKIHHSTPCGICFMWKQSNQREQNFVWAYFLETCRRRSLNMQMQLTCSGFYFLHDEESCSREDGSCSKTALKWWWRLDWKDWGCVRSGPSVIWFTCTFTGNKSDWTTMIFFFTVSAFPYKSIYQLVKTASFVQFASKPS